jgi:hypothetical protein
MSAISFATDIKPLFREQDREAMLSHFDLWNYSEVNEHADVIAERLRDGSMPCDAPWPEDDVELFDHWIEAGKAE